MITATKLDIHEDLLRYLVKKEADKMFVDADARTNLFGFQHHACFQPTGNHPRHMPRQQAACGGLAFFRWFYQRPQFHQPGMFQPRGSGFLGSALTTAAGVEESIMPSGLMVSGWPRRSQNSP